MSVQNVLNMVQTQQFTRRKNKMAAVDSDVVFDIWEAFKVLVPAKERMNAAERLIKICDDVGFQKEDIAEMAENDKILETAFDIYFQDDYDEDEDDDSWDDYDE